MALPIPRAIRRSGAQHPARDQKEWRSTRLGHSDDYLHRTLKGTRWATVQDLVALAQAACNADILTGGLATETLATELLSMAWPLPGDASPR